MNNDDWFAISVGMLAIGMAIGLGMGAGLGVGL